MKKTKIQIDIITPQWLTLKEMYENGTNGSKEYGANFPIGGELDQLSSKLVNELGLITQQLGYDCLIEGIKLNLWKERVWCLIENAGLLPEIAWRDEETDEKEIKDNWYDIDNEEEWNYLIEEPSTSELIK